LFRVNSLLHLRKDNPNLRLLRLNHASGRPLIVVFRLLQISEIEVLPPYLFIRPQLSPLVIAVPRDLQLLLMALEGHPVLLDCIVALAHHFISLDLGRPVLQLIGYGPHRF
jgi:hypothetical protein